VGGQHHAPATLSLRGVQDAGWAGLNSKEKVDPPPGFGARTVQSLASRYKRLRYTGCHATSAANTNPPLAPEFPFKF